MKITPEKLRELGACQEGIGWFELQSETSLEGICDKLISADKVSWVNWLLTRLMNKTQRVEYAIFAAEQVLNIFEAKYPKDLRPRKAIEAAKEYLKNQTDAAAYAADAAARAAACAAACAANAAADAAACAAYAATHAANAAARAANAANAADGDANAAADAAANAADGDANAATYAANAAAKKEMQLKIIKYGLKLLTQK